MIALLGLHGDDPSHPAGHDATHLTCLDGSTTKCISAPGPEVAGGHGPSTGVIVFVVVVVLFLGYRLRRRHRANEGIDIERVLPLVIETRYARTPGRLRGRSGF